MGFMDFFRPKESADSKQAARRESVQNVLSAGSASSYVKQSVEQASKGFGNKISIGLTRQQLLELGRQNDGELNVSVVRDINEVYGYGSARFGGTLILLDSKLAFLYNPDIRRLTVAPN
jgi:hypothetical protein